MNLSKYLYQNEVTQLNQAFEISLQHDSALVFWTGISPDLARNWARRNNLKTLTMAMGSLYTENSKEGLRSQKITKSWSKYMKGASWVFAQQACHNRCAIVLTNAPPNVYSTRVHSNYREIEEPILKGFEAERHTIQIDYVHPAVPGAACFRYQVWPDNRSSEWLRFLECIAVKDIVNKIVQCIDLQRSKTIKESEYTTPPQNKSGMLISLTTSVAVGGNRKPETAQEKAAVKQLKAKREQQAAREKKAAKRLKAEREQQAAREKKAAKRLKAEREQQAAREKKAAKRLKAEREQQVAREKKAAKRLKAEREQQAAREKKAAKRLKAERKQQAAREKKAAKRFTFADLVSNDKARS